MNSVLCDMAAPCRSAVDRACNSAQTLMQTRSCCVARSEGLDSAVSGGDRWRRCRGGGSHPAQDAPQRPLEAPDGFRHRAHAVALPAPGCIHWVSTLMHEKWCDLGGNVLKEYKAALVCSTRKAGQKESVQVEGDWSCLLAGCWQMPCFRTGSSRCCCWAC